ncbi:hypothetical protein SVIOM342S_05763 [Streptomyces violaceorubidus]
MPSRIGVTSPAPVRRGGRRSRTTRRRRRCPPGDGDGTATDRPVPGRRPTRRAAGRALPGRPWPAGSLASRERPGAATFGTVRRAGPNGSSVSAAPSERRRPAVVARRRGRRPGRSPRSRCRRRRNRRPGTGAGRRPRRRRQRSGGYGRSWRISLKTGSTRLRRYGAVVAAVVLSGSGAEQWCGVEVVCGGSPSARCRYAATGRPGSGVSRRFAVCVVSVLPSHGESGAGPVPDGSLTRSSEEVPAALL